MENDSKDMLIEQLQGELKRLAEAGPGMIHPSPEDLGEMLKRNTTCKPHSFETVKPLDGVLT